MIPLMPNEMIFSEKMNLKLVLSTFYILIT